MIENPHSAATCIITGSVNDDKTTKYKAVAAAANLRQSCPTLCDPTRLHRPWDSPGKRTRVGCHCLFHKAVRQ